MIKVLVLGRKSNINEMLYTLNPFLRDGYYQSSQVSLRPFLLPDLKAAQVDHDHQKLCLTLLAHFYHQRNKGKQTLLLESKTLHTIMWTSKILKIKNSCYWLVVVFPPTYYS